MKHAIVIGGGPAGIKAAHSLQKQGVRVTLLEHAEVLGGLASSFDVQGVRIERYYHFICKGDDHLVDTLSELGLSHKLCWRDSSMRTESRMSFAEGGDAAKTAPATSAKQKTKHE